MSSAHLSYNPRLLKEADALHEAGYAVRVVAMNVEPAKATYDERLMRSRPWRLERVNARRDSPGGRLRWLCAALRQRMYQQVYARWGIGLERAHSRYYGALGRLAAREPAALFIAHNLPALPAAAFAARRWGARLGFDAEDFHRGEVLADDPAQALWRRLTVAVEEKYLPRCDHLTAASDGIAEAYARVVGVRRPVTVLNVFPLAERNGRVAAEALERERRGGAVSLYWYSQVIGADRGLNDALEALARLPEAVHLHLRGAWAAGCETVFQEKIRALGVERRVHILPPVPPEELVERAAQHDVGLALEMGHTENRRIAVTNKILLYFVAGLAIAASDVPSQRAILESAPDAGFLYPAGDGVALAERLRAWVERPGRLIEAKAAARAWGEKRFCWEREKDALVRAIGRLVGETWNRQLSHG
ncbi:MAG: glycosyltransferase [Verrucomicrobiales bacterium]|nr:glycosyltransferase [Verrucomicrobiales bacterium]